MSRRDVGENDLSDNLVEVLAGLLNSSGFARPLSGDIGEIGVIGDRADVIDLFIGEFGADLLENLTAARIDLNRLPVDLLLLVVDIVEVLCIPNCSVGDIGVMNSGFVADCGVGSCLSFLIFVVESLRSVPKTLNDFFLGALSSIWLASSFLSFSSCRSFATLRSVAGVSIWALDVVVSGGLDA